MTDKEIWVAAYLAAVAGGHRSPLLAAEQMLADYGSRWPADRPETRCAPAGDDLGADPIRDLDDW